MIRCKNKENETRREFSLKSMEYELYIDSIQKFIPERIRTFSKTYLDDCTINSIYWSREHKGLVLTLSPDNLYVIFHEVVHTNANWTALENKIWTNEFFLLDEKYEINILFEDTEVVTICKDISFGKNKT